MKDYLDSLTCDTDFYAFSLQPQYSSLSVKHYFRINNRSGESISLGKAQLLFKFMMSG